MTQLFTFWTIVLCVGLSCVLAKYKGGKITVNCEENGCVKDKFSIKYDREGFDPFMMDPNNFNHLTYHSFEINKDTCFKEFTYKAEGLSDNKSTANSWKWNDDSKNIESTIPVNFGKENQPSNCQNIRITIYANGTSCGEKIFKVTYLNNVNPLKEWIEEKERKEKYSFPDITLENHITPHISWEKITSKFECDFKLLRTKGNITYTAHRTDKEEIKKATQFVDGRSFKEMFKVQKYPNLDKKDQCYTWKVVINIKLDFYLTSRKSEGLVTEFERQTEKVPPSALNIKIMKKNNGSIKNTYLKIEEIDKKELRCLENETDIQLWSTDDSQPKKERLPINYFSPIDARIDLEPFLDKNCVEAQALIKIYDTKHNLIEDKLVEIYPELQCTTSENTINLNITNQQFQGCDLTYRISCRTWNSSSPNDAEIMDQKGTEFTVENLEDKNCSVIAFIEEPTDNENQWFYKRLPVPCYDIGPKRVEEKLSVGVIAASVIISILAAFGAAFVYQRSRSKKRKNRKPVARISIRETEDPHFVIHKKDNLGSHAHETNKEATSRRENHIKETLWNLVEQQDDIGDEFNKADDYSRREIVSKESTEIAKNEVNKFRNRYTDMVPYDSNIIHLKMKTGNPPSSYMNASLIKFEGMEQDFIAIQAPKPHMFGSFWQLVWEQDVSVIVMITGLVEGGRTKAHQYWPDKDELVMDFGQVGLTVKYVNHSYPGTYFHRTILITNDKGKEKRIDHLQTNEWADMAAPRTTKILLDLLYKSDELMDERTGPIMVHCSAGVGRTGTYIGLYKLVNDYNDDSVEKIDFYQTLIEMRKQRMMMIQKPVQYHYMVKCLSDYVASETSDYA